MSRDWNIEEFRNSAGALCEIRVAPRYAADYVVYQLRDTSHQDITQQLNHWKENEDGVEWSYIGYVNNKHTFIMYDQTELEFSKKHGEDMTWKVMDILRNGKPEPDHWETGQDPTEVWST